MHQETLSWLYKFVLHGIKLDLENTTILLKKLGDPQNKMKHIHVGGSDGKGSISSCIASVLISSGIKTGLYTSPHIEQFNERITVNGVMITDEEIEELYVQMKECVAEMEAEGRSPTFFEVTTAMAFLYFMKKGVEYAVIEVGMGGRLDSTNVILPEVCVIGNISMEHQEYLGDTIEKIAFEKAGIIKPGVPCVTLNEDPAFGVLKKAAEERGAPLIRIDPKDISVDLISEDGAEFLYKEERYKVSIPGIRQADNASMAIEAVSKLKIYGQCVRCNLKKGLKDVRWPCRMEKIGPLPLIFDVSHTAAGSKALASDISFLYGKVDVVIGMLKDKDIQGMAESLSKVSDWVYVAGLETERTADPEDLKKAFARCSKEVLVCGSMHEAMDQAMSSRREGRNILVTGSFYTAEEAISWLRRTYPGYWTYSQRSTAKEHIPDGRPKA